MSKENRYKIVKDYIMEHVEDYTPMELRYMMSNYDMGKHTKFAPDVLRQIYDHLGLIKDEDNMYKGFVSLIKEVANIDSNIIEVGGGVIPVVGEHISLEQKIGKITVYDPKISRKYTNNKLELKRENFTHSTDLTGADLIIGFMPCMGTEILIKHACENKIDFIVALCEGEHNAFDDYWDEEEWRNSIYHLARVKLKENDLGELIETDLKSYGDPYPVIYNKRRK